MFSNLLSNSNKGFIILNWRVGEAMDTGEPTPEGAVSFYYSWSRKTNHEIIFEIFLLYGIR
jgi:hypothetical protein